MYIPDTGYPSRAFAFGSTLGLISSLVLGQKERTKDNRNFRSSYRHMALSFLGIIFVWCSYPILILNSGYNSASGKIMTMAGQVNIWLALAASVLGCYTASSLILRKFSVHDMIFGSITVYINLYREQLHTAHHPILISILEHQQVLAS